MYKLFAVFSAFIRTFYMPNPFEPINNKFSFDILTVTCPIPADLINMLVEPLIHLLTYSVVGIYYTKGSKPLVGSILYLVFYFIHVGLLYLMSLAAFETWAVIAITAAYVVFHLFIISIKNRFDLGGI